MPPLKYNPYRGYGRIPHYFLLYPYRLRTRSDWRWHREPPRCSSWWRRPHVPDTYCLDCHHFHCPCQRCHEPWKRWRHRSNDSRFEKRDLHRRFRQQSRAAIRRELDGDDGVSHAFRAYGDWLD